MNPRASRDAVNGWLGEALKISVAAAPERGKANAAVEELIAKVAGVPRSAVRVVVGHTQPRKIVEVEGLSCARLAEKLPSR